MYIALHPYLGFFLTQLDVSHGLPTQYLDQAINPHLDLVREVPRQIRGRIGQRIFAPLQSLLRFWRRGSSRAEVQAPSDAVNLQSREWMLAYSRLERAI